MMGGSWSRTEKKAAPGDWSERAGTLSEGSRPEKFYHVKAIFKGRCDVEGEVTTDTHDIFDKNPEPK
jgi:hypothetical protein